MKHLFHFFTFLLLISPIFANATVSNLRATNDSTKAYYQFSYTGTPTQFRLFLDTNSSLSSGYTKTSGGVGAEFMIEGGSLYRYSGGTTNSWDWTKITTVTYSNSSGIARWTVPLSAINSPAKLNLVGQVGATGQPNVNSAILTQIISAVVTSTSYQIDPNAFSGAVLIEPKVIEVRKIAGGASQGSGGAAWGGHQPRVIHHKNGTLRILYLYGDRIVNSTVISWRLMKRPAGSTLWSLEAGGSTAYDALLLRDPISDSAHVIAFPNKVPTIHSSTNAFKPITIPGWSGKDINIYNSAGIGPDGRLVLKLYHDRKDPDLDISTDLLFISGKFNGTSWNFTPVYSRYIGPRHVYDYIFPGAFGDLNAFAATTMRDMNNRVAGLPNLIANYVWDGLRQYNMKINDPSSMVADYNIPIGTPPSTTTTVANWMGQNDTFIDSRRRMLNFTRINDPKNPPAQTRFTVTNNMGDYLHRSVPTADGTIGGGGIRIIEDAKKRLWITEFVNSPTDGVMAKVYRLNSDFSFGPAYNLSSSFPNLPFKGHTFIAVPRGGNMLGDSFEGYFVSDTDIVYYKIRLPN
jgi:hypothetical protein